MAKALSLFFILLLISLILGNPVFAGDLTAGLVAHWGFEEGQGDTAYDSSPCENDAFLLDGPTWITGRISDYAMHFAGLSDRVEAPDSATLDITDYLTVSVWAKTDTIDTRQVIVCKNAPWHNSWILEINPLDFEGTRFNFYLDLFGFDGNFGGNTPVVANQWYHVVCTYDGSERRLYIDGQFDAAQPVAGAIPENDEPIRIGAYADTTRQFKGDIDNVRIYNRALSEDEVWQLYVADLSASGTPANLTFAVIRLESAITRKTQLLESADAALAEELLAYEAFDELLKGTDFGSLTKKDIIEARQQTHAAIQHLHQSIIALQKSIERLQLVLQTLNVEPPATSAPSDSSAQ